MGQVFKKTTTRPIPAGAYLVKVGGKLTARWKGRGSKAKWNTAPVVTLDDGRQVIRQESSTYFARTGIRIRRWSSSRPDAGMRKRRSKSWRTCEKRVQRIKAGVLTPAEDAASEQQKRNVGHHVDATSRP